MHKSTKIISLFLAFICAVEAKKRFNASDFHVEFHVKHLEELSDYSFETLQREKSLDERLADTIYLVTEYHLGDPDYVKITTGDTERDATALQLFTGSSVDDELCGSHLKQMIDLMDELNQRVILARTNHTNNLQLEDRHIRLSRVLDSFGHYEAGFISGRYMSLGMYSQCLDTDLILGSAENPQRVASRYCMAKLRIDKHLNELLKSRPLPNNKEPFILTGICIPKTCHTLSFVKHKHLLQKLVDSQFKLPKSQYIDENLELGDIFCVQDNESNLGVPLNGKILIALTTILVATILAVTFNQSFIQQISSAKIRFFLGSLNLKSSFEKFFIRKVDKTRDESRVKLDCLNFVKVFFCAYIVIAHLVVISTQYFMDRIEGAHLIDNNPIIGILISGLTIIDSFQVMTGIIVTYISLQKLDRQYQNEGKQRNGIVPMIKWCLSFILVRYLRVLPLYFFVYWFKKGVLIHLGSGPLWDSGFNRETLTGFCKQSSWSLPFEMLLAFIPMMRQCLPQAWYMANELAFSYVMGPIIYIMVKRPKIAIMICILLATMSNYLMYNAFSSLSPYDKENLKDLKTHGIASMFNSPVMEKYASPELRLSTPLTGIIAGYILFQYQHQHIKQWPSWLKGPVTLVSVVIPISLVAFSIFRPFLRMYFIPYHRTALAYMMLVFKIIWPITNAVIFLRLTSDWKDTLFGKLSGAHFWAVNVKLMYPILLIHLDIMIYHSMIQTTTSYFTLDYVIFVSAATYFFSLLIGTFLHLVIEHPADKLTKALLSGTQPNEEEPVNKLTVYISSPKLVCN